MKNLSEKMQHTVWCNREYWLIVNIVENFIEEHDDLTKWYYFSLGKLTGRWLLWHNYTTTFIQLPYYDKGYIKTAKETVLENLVILILNKTKNFRDLTRAYVIEEFKNNCL